jgi:hypothetical protein
VTGKPPPLTRIARGEAERFPKERIRSVDRPAVYWDGEAFVPARITGWIRYYGELFVRLRTRRDVWRDREDWYVWAPGHLIVVRPDPMDRKDWLPPRPFTG